MLAAVHFSVKKYAAQEESGDDTGTEDTGISKKLMADGRAGEVLVK
jgi:hypothetical protein